MLRMALREIWTRRLLSGVAFLGLFTATLGFVLLTAGARTTQAQLLGDIDRSWNAPYQLLVRPPGSLSPLEQSAGLVRPNYLSGLIGGITPAQLAQIRQLRGVVVAAPIAIVGFVQWPTAFRVDAASLAPGGFGVFRVSATATGDAGLSTYRLGPARTIVYAAGGSLRPQLGAPTALMVGDRMIVCDALAHVACLAPRITSLRGETAGIPTNIVVPFPQPLLVAGVDPDAEAALSGLDQCVGSGRYLSASDAPTLDQVQATTGPIAQPTLPILVSEKSFVDEMLTIRIEAASDAAAVLTSTSPAALAGWQSVRTVELTADEMYRQYVSSLSDTRVYNPSPLWAPTDVRYVVEGSGHVSVPTVSPDFTVFANPLLVGVPLDELVPEEARDLWFRGVQARPQQLRSEAPNGWRTVGSFDPECVAGRSAMADGLQAFALPRLQLPDGGMLRPTRSIAGYINSPALLLTTLAGASWFANSERFAGAPGEAFISAIRIRVSGAEQPGPVAEARLSTIAADIYEQTGLAVDIVVGSSPREMRVDLPAGTNGRPALTASEGWSVKGVAFRFVQAVTAQNLALFGLLLTAALALVASTTYASVQRRRREFGVLRALGWPSRSIGILVLLEVIVLSVAAAVVGVSVGLPLARIASQEVAIEQVLLILPLGLLVSLAAAALPAVLAARGSVRGVMAHQGTARPSRLHLRPATVALDDLLRTRRAEALIGVLAMAVASAALALLVLIAVGFDGQLDATVLGTYLSARVRGFHVALVLLLLVISALAAGQVAWLGHLDRRSELAALRALGWPGRALAEYVIAQAAAVGTVGAAAGALVAIVAGATLGAPPIAMGLAAVAAATSGVVAALVAASVPTVDLVRSAPADALRGE